MKPTRAIFRFCTALMFWAAASPIARADSLVTTDGEVLLGTITKTPNGYSIQTTDGPVDVPAEKVKRILYDHPPAGETRSTGTTAPGTPGTPGTLGTSGTPTGAPGSSTVKKPADPREVAALLQQGQAALAAGEFADARDAFTDLLSIAKDNPLAARGLGYAYLKLNKPTKALKPLELAALNPPVDRSLTMALAASLVESHNPMRAAKFVKAYLDAHPQDVDEPVINALGISLSQADSTAAKSTLFIEGVKLYNRLNAELEAKQEGKKRWGIEWQDADEVTKKQKARQDAQKKVDDTWARLQAADAQLSSAQSELSSAQQSGTRRRDQQVQAAQNRIDTAQTAVDRAQSAYDDAMKALGDVPGPVFPTVIALEDVDLSLSPGPVVASAVPAPTPPSVVVAPPMQAPTPAATPTPTPTPAATPTHDPVETKTETAPTPSSTHTPAEPPPKVDNKSTTAKPAPPAAAHLTRYAAGFAISPDLLVTAASAVDGATDIQITTEDGRTIKAEVVRMVHGDGIALLKAEGAKLPTLPLATTAASGALTCYGFPEVALFNPVAKPMNATAGDQSESWTASFGMAPRLPGAPLIKAGAVVGVELGDRESDLTQIPAASLKALMGLVQGDAHPGTMAQDPKTAVVMVAAQR
jgi:S1-C subfamily serine protease